MFGMLNEQGKRIAEELEAELEDLESQAGITRETERAREGRLFGGLDDSETLDEYDDREWDYLKRGIRAAYFSMSDSELRERLISTQRKIEDNHLKGVDDEILKLQQEVRTAERKQENVYSWGSAAVIGGVCVYLGHSYFGLSGAIGGAVVGLFLGFGYLHRSRVQSKALLEEAIDNLNEFKKIREENIEGNFFTLNEELTGKPDDRHQEA